MHFDLPTLKHYATFVPPWLFITVIAHFFILGTVAYLILLERKVASWAQDRIGPNRTGLGFGLFFKGRHFWGLGQPLADGAKAFFKEDYRPKNSDRILFTLAPGLMITVIIISIATLPFAGVKQSVAKVDVSAATTPAEQLAVAKAGVPWWATPTDALITTYPVPGYYDVNGITSSQTRTFADIAYRWGFNITSLNIGVLYILAVLGLAVYGVVIAGYASNNKYSFLGGLRATSNMISYEIPLGLCILCIVAMYGTLDLGVIVERQATGIWNWNIFAQPLTFFLFLVCLHAEANRAPFDTAECEQELVAGYHTEYSSMRFALFFLSEYAGMITTSAVCVCLFFGGWHLPGLGGNVDGAGSSVTTSWIVLALRVGVFFAKTMAVLVTFMWVRWSLPRFRFDQVMLIAWRGMIPLSLALLVCTAIVIWAFGGMTRPDGEIPLVMRGALLVMNAAVFVGAIVASKLLPAPPPVNRKIRVPGSRFAVTPVAAV